MGSCTCRRGGRGSAATRARIDAGAVQPGESLGLTLHLETGEVYPGEGEMVSPGASVSTTTGTATFRIRFDNPERRIMPGQFLRVDGPEDFTRLGTGQMIFPMRGLAMGAGL